MKDFEQLLSVKTGKDYIISSLRTTPETSMRLRELGFNENTIIRTIINRSSQLICEVNNTRIGLHHHTAKDILVSSLK